MIDVAGSSRLHFLSDLVERINSGKSVQEVLDLVHERLREYVPYSRIAVAVTDENRERITIIAVRSDGKILMNKGYGGPLAGSSLEGLLRNGRIRRIDDLQDYLIQKPESEATRVIVREGMRSSLTLPLLVDGHPVGLMFFSSRDPKTYGPQHEDFLRTIAGHVAIAVEKSLLMDAIREKSDFLENILQSSADAIIVEDREGRIRTWNTGAREMYGYEASEILGQPFEVLVPSDLLASGEVERIRERVGREGYLRDYETVRVTKDGRRLSVNITSTALRNPQSRYLGRSAVHRNVSHLRKLQEELARTQSLAAVGELSATIAHEIKNPLAGISGAIQVLRDAIPENDRRRFVVSEILEQISRLDNTVRDLLTFARPMAPVRHDVDVARSLRHAWSVVGPQPGGKAVRFLVEGNGLRLSGDPHLLEQVWINLFQNAVDAMPKGGDLLARVSDEGNVRVEVRDTGSGMDSAHLAKLFRPFFSTKTRGTGLGLAISKKIVEAHGGTIKVSSVPDRGTSVFVEIPK